VVTATKAIYKPGVAERRRNVSPQNATAGPDTPQSICATSRTPPERTIWLRCRSTSRRSLSLLHRILRNTTGRVDKQGNGAARVVQAGDKSNARLVARDHEEGDELAPFQLIEVHSIRAGPALVCIELGVSMTRFC
jgi:hypothetical protein